MDKKRAVVFDERTVNQYFSTDTKAALRMGVIDAEVILMAKKDVDDVYAYDPKVSKSAKKYDNITYMEMLNKCLGIMDSTASSLCMDNEIPLIVFSIMEEGNIKKVITGDSIGTIIRGK